MNAATTAQTWLSQLELGVVPTFACNLRCSHCFVAGQGAQPHMPLEAFLTLLRQAETLGLRSLQITGGEFFAYKHRLAALQHLAGARLPVGISTNGTLINRDDVALLRETRVKLCFSLDGPPEVHDGMRGDAAFARTAQAAAHCVRYEVPFDVSTTVTRTTLPHLPATVITAVNLGAQSINVSPIYDLGGRSTTMADEQLDDEQCIDMLALLTALRDFVPEGFGVYTQNMGMRAHAIKHPCAVCACWGEFCHSKKYWPDSLFAMPDGEVLPQTLHIDRRYSLGNAFGRGLSAVIQTYWGSDRHRRFQKLCRHVYQDLIYGSERPFYYWDELLRAASAQPLQELPSYETVSHPHDHSQEIAEARRRGELDSQEVLAQLG